MRKNAEVFARTYRHLQADFVAPSHAETFSLASMLKNLQSAQHKRQDQIDTEVVATLNQVAEALADMSADDSGTPSKDVLGLLGGVVALCADVLVASSYAPGKLQGGRYEDE